MSNPDDGSTEAVDAASATRRCWRCLQQFPLDPDEPVRPKGLAAGWWVCDACHATLIPGKG